MMSVPIGFTGRPVTINPTPAQRKVRLLARIATLGEVRARGTFTQEMGDELGRLEIELRGLEA